jgi:hypothetical protein
MVLAKQTYLAFGGRFFVDMHAFGLWIAAFLLFCYCAKWAGGRAFRGSTREDECTLGWMYYMSNEDAALYRQRVLTLTLTLTLR